MSYLLCLHAFWQILYCLETSLQHVQAPVMAAPIPNPPTVSWHELCWISSWKLCKQIFICKYCVSCTALSFFIVSTVLCATSSGISDSNTCHGFLAVYHKFHLQFSCWFQKSQKIRKMEPPPPGGGRGGVPFWQFSFIEPFCGNPKPTGKLLGFMWKQLCMLNFQKLPSSKPFIS